MQSHNLAFVFINALPAFFLHYQKNRLLPCQRYSNSYNTNSIIVLIVVVNDALRV